MSVQLPSPAHITLFSGHYGSGKTNIAINYAEWICSRNKKVTVADLDIVNPYFRTQDSRERLLSQGIELICSPFAGSNLDAPAMPAETYALIADSKGYAVLDIGGDERGALALGRHSRTILEENNYEALFVFNAYRPLTSTAKEAYAVLREIEDASALPFTALVHNSNLGPYTTRDDVLSMIDKVYELSSLSGLPVKMHCANVSVAPLLHDISEPVFPLTIQKLYYQLNTP